MPDDRNDQVNLGQVSKEVMDQEDLKRLARREQEEELERIRRRNLMYTFLLTEYYNRQSERMYERGYELAQKTFRGEIQPPRREAMERIAREASALEMRLNIYDDFHKQYHMDHVGIHGIRYMENNKTVKTEAEKKAMGRNFFTQDSLDAILYAVQLNDPQSDFKVAREAIEDYAKGNTKPLGRILGQAIRTATEECMKTKDTASLQVMATGIKEMLNVLELHNDLLDTCTLTKDELYTAYGNVFKDFAQTRAMTAMLTLDSAKETGMPLPDDFREECLKDIVTFNVISKRVDARTLGALGIQVEDINKGVLPEALLVWADIERQSLDEKQLEGLLNPPIVLPKDDELKKDMDDPVLDKELEPLQPDAPVLGGHGVLGL